ncbi:catechol 2,3-dioxygenase-like lactoylglutathione lyase family enzyme [Gracilibacillus halotolerans]|uniref:Catechol 2,3-dioxygenase-like lactoylglutathione lyase family enzyme n=1 Tax=Gracilibacillus halotolerans TaxID=74386 RepID=A0A841RNJ4_9BACI|nr:VOC family protein [Gracilibacillus halotolerans]MBB6513452.1 catechol 2,3-dioxygenase-like lactoylglutathione lyase family enzyme [Gracilibacillus halotolerans]
MIIGLHHAQVTIPKGAEDKGRAFYCGVLGLTEVEKPTSLKDRGGFWLKLGNQELHVGTEDGFDRTKTKAHIAYQVNDIEYWRNRLKENHIEILSSIPIPGFERFECRDPFGNRLEMIQVVEAR